MDKSKVCITKAVKAVRASYCNKKQNLLVFQRGDPCYPPKPPRKEVYTVTPLSSPAAKKIKVCTGRDLKRMCQPKLCECPPKHHMGPLQCFMMIVGSTMKTGLAVAMIYWTYNIGLWGPPTQTEQIYYGMCHAVCESTFLDKEATARKRERMFEECPALKTAICPKDYSIEKECCKYPPNFDQTVFQLSQIWNTGITCIFDFMVNGPQRIEEFWAWANERYESLLNMRNSECQEPKGKDLAKCKINR